jgi:chemotaxis protein methyltransferase CheR
MSHTLGDQSRVREYRYTDADFRHIRKTLYDHAGISLSDYKKDMAYNRLVRRLRALNLNGFAEYFAYLESTPDEFGQFINALTTNLTSFFRENHHFECLKNQVLPALDKSGQRRIRIWSAGCSVGEEPYSIAMSCQMAGIDLQRIDLKILATDIDSTVLATARSGEYGLERIQSIPENYQKKFIEFSKQKPNVAMMSAKIRNMITFNELNLMQSWPMKGPMDVIFCRNVMIYFDKETQVQLLDRMAELLTPNGILFVGHSETPFRLTDRFKLVGQTIYRRVY